MKRTFILTALVLSSCATNHDVKITREPKPYLKCKQVRSATDYWCKMYDPVKKRYVGKAKIIKSRAR